MRATRHCEQRRIVEVSLELLRIQSSRHDYNFEVVSALGDLLEQGHQNIRRKGSLVSFVNDDAGVPRHVVVVHTLAQQLTVGHVLEEGLLGGTVVETYRVTDLLSEFNVHLVCDTLSDTGGSDTTGLGTSDQLAGELGEFIVDDILRDLCCLSGTGLTDKHHDLGVVVDVEELLAVLVDRQISPPLENSEVLGTVRLASPGVVVGVFELCGGVGGGLLTSDAVEGRPAGRVAAGAILTIVVMRKVRIVLFHAGFLSGAFWRGGRVSVGVGAGPFGALGEAAVSHNDSRAVSDGDRGRADGV